MIEDDNRNADREEGTSLHLETLREAYIAGDVAFADKSGFDSCPYNPHSVDLKEAKLAYHWIEGFSDGMFEKFNS